MTDSDKALAWTKSLPTDRRPDVLGAAIGSLMQVDPQAAVHLFQDHPKRQTALTEMIGSWFAREPAEATRWIATSKIDSCW